MNRCCTSGVASATAPATSDLYAEVMKTFAPQSSTMYAISSAVSRDEMAV